MSDLKQTKTNNEASNGKLKLLSSEVGRARTEIDRGVSLSKMIVLLGEQNSLIGEQNTMKGVK